MINMFAVCALIPLSCISAVLAFEGGSAPLVFAETLILMPITKIVRRYVSIKHIIVPICMISVVFRFLSVFERCFSALDIGRSILLTAVCIALAGIAAYNGKGAFFSATPIMVLSVFLAIYITIVSFASEPRASYGIPSLIEWCTAIFCPISACVAFSEISDPATQKCYKGCVAGIALSAIFLLFSHANAEIGFLSVPLAVGMSAIELSAVFSVILNRKSE